MLRHARGRHDYRGVRDRRGPFYRGLQHRGLDGLKRHFRNAGGALDQHLSGAFVRRDGRGASLRRRHVPVCFARPWARSGRSGGLELHHFACGCDGRRSACLQLLLQNPLFRVRLHASGLGRCARARCDARLYCRERLRRQNRGQAAKRLHVLFLGRGGHLVSHDDPEHFASRLCADTLFPAAIRGHEFRRSRVHDLVVLCRV